MKVKPFVFFLPDIIHIPSGGNIYNERLIHAIKSLGVECRLEIIAEDDKLPAMELDAYYWVDSLLLNNIPAHRPKNHPRLGLLVHHLLSMEQERDTRVVDSQKMLEREALLRYHRFLCTSEFTKNYLYLMGVEAWRMLVIKPVFPQRKFSKKPSGTREVKLIMVANLIPRKGILPFLMAFKKHIPRMQPFHLHIIGSKLIDQEYAQACEHTILEDEELYHRVSLTGAVQQQEVESYLRQSDIFISASSMETFGMAIQEAIAFELPVLLLKGGYSERHLEGQQFGKAFDRLDDLCVCLVDWVNNGVSLEKSIDSESIAPSNSSWEAAAMAFIDFNTKQKK